MRQIYFRAKTINEGEWVYSLTIAYGTIERKKHSLFMEIEPSINKWKGIRPDTVGQFTGLTDCNGKEIYEGDIIKIDCHPWLDEQELDSVNATIVFDDYMWIAQWDNPNAGKPYFHIMDDDFGVEPKYISELLGSLPNTIEVIGNVFDNPDLLTDKLNKQ